ncbi:MAG TPA: nucleotidyl transferase AbiEii/AbiGii toxin family protein [Lacisediminihabitans sp.]|uniref:nucleotidyl transferase AbiEii/AbiGii toxin family protein n=1 Tax=Lacisediminihabitans sp. TaxID=2787631 RepID=UPI002ED9780C
MSPAIERGTPAGDAHLAIQRLARQTGGDVQELQTLYVLESWLARLAVSAYRDDFVVKGGVLLAAFATRRPTRDIDLRASGLPNDVDEVAARARAIADHELPDGVVFESDSVTASSIRDDDLYAGVRVKLVGRLGRSRLTIGIDVNFGDPIWPQLSLVKLPRVVQLVGQQSVVVLGYPLTMVLAEKVATAISRGEANTRWRDFADLYTLIRGHSVRAEELAGSLETVATYRGVELLPLAPALAQMPQSAQSKWRAWRSRVRREHDLPLEFTDVLRSVAGFTDPILTGLAEATWDVRSATWIR